MARTPKPLGGHTLTARIIQLACRLKAQREGISEYTLKLLELESGLNHSVILRAVKEGGDPTLETVQKLAQALEVASDPELEDRFYNAFRYASPRQLAAVEPYVEQQEAQEEGHLPTS